MDPALVPYAKKRSIIDALNQVALNVDAVREKDRGKEGVMGFLEGIYRQYVGYEVVPRFVGGLVSLGAVEGFQSTLTEQAKTSLTTFFTLWNGFPSGLTKARDISNMISTTWAGYVSATNTVDYTGNNFGNLDITLSRKHAITFSYINTTISRSITFSSVKFNKTVSLNDLSTSINQQTSVTTYSCAGITCDSCTGAITLNKWGDITANVIGCGGTYITQNGTIRTNSCYCTGKSTSYQTSSGNKYFK